MGFKLSNSNGFLSHTLLEARRAANRQLEIQRQYAKATGQKGLPKTKEGQNWERNRNNSYINTLTHFCKTAPKAKKDKHQSAGVVALSSGAT